MAAAHRQMQRENEKAMTRVARMTIDTNYADAQVQRAAAQADRERRRVAAEEDRYLRGYERRAIADRREADQRLRQQERQAIADKREEDKRQRDEERRFKRDNDTVRREYESRPENRAQQRRQNERNKALEDAEYKKIYGEGDDENQRKITYETVRIAHRLRRHVGGLVGGLIGIFADMMYDMQKAGDEAQRRERTAKLLREARIPVGIGLASGSTAAQQIAQQGGQLAPLSQSQTSIPQVQTSAATPTSAATSTASAMHPPIAYSPPAAPSTALPFTTAAATVQVATAAAQYTHPAPPSPPPPSAPTTDATTNAAPAELIAEEREVDLMRSEAARRAAETRRRDRAADDARINHYRRMQAEALGGSGTEFETIQEERARVKKERDNELARARRARRNKGTVAPIRKKPYPTSLRQSMSGLSEALGIDVPDEEDTAPYLSPKGTSGGKGRIGFAEGGELPRMAGGGWFSKILGLGQKERPAEPADITPPLADITSAAQLADLAEDDIHVQQGTSSERHKIPKQVPYDVEDWQKNNQLRDSLREALSQAGYDKRDISNLASNRDILQAWSAGWSVADLRRTNLLSYDPYSPSDIEVVGSQPSPEVSIPDPSIPEGSLPNLPLAKRKTKAQLLATAAELGIPAKSRWTNKQIEDAIAVASQSSPSATESPLKLTRKRPKQIYGAGQQESETPPDVFPFMSGGGELPRMARGGKYPVALPFQAPPEPVVQPFQATLGAGQQETTARSVPQLSDFSRKLVGAEANVKFTDPNYQLSDQELLETYKRNQPVPLPPGIKVPPKFAQDWYAISRLMPEAARIIEKIARPDADDTARVKRRSAKYRASFAAYKHTPDEETPAGYLKVDPENYDRPEILWHELVHAEQHLRGDLLREPAYTKTGELTPHGRMMESEAYQRGLQGPEILDRLKKELQRERASQRAELPHHATGGRAQAAIVGDLPGQSLESIKSDPHTEVILGNQVIPHHEAVRHGMFDGRMPRHATGTGGQTPEWHEPDWFKMKWNDFWKKVYGEFDAVEKRMAGKEEHEAEPKVVQHGVGGTRDRPSVLPLSEQEYIDSLKQDEARKEADRSHEERHAARLDEYYQHRHGYGPYPEATLEPEESGPFGARGWQPPPPEAIDPRRVQGAAENAREARLRELDQSNSMAPSSYTVDGLTQSSEGIPGLQRASPPPLPPEPPPFVVRESPGDAGMVGIPGMSSIMSTFSKVLPMVGPILDGLKLLSTAATGAVKATIGGTSGVANWAASADSDPSKTLEGMGDAVSKAGDAMSSIIPFSGLWTTALGESTKALGMFMQAVDKTAERYGEVSGSIAAQQAMGEIRQVMGDLRRAQEVGPEIVRYMKTQQDMQQKFEDIKVKILTKLLSAINPALEVIDKLLPTLEAVMEGPITALLQPIQAIAEAINSLVGTQRDDRLPTVQDPADILLSRTVQGRFGRTRQQEVGADRNF